MGIRKILLVSFAITIGCSLLFTPSSFAQDINTGLIAKYEFNGNADDSSGNGFDAIVNASLSTDKDGKPNSCYFFNGTTNYIDFPNAEMLKPELPVSISFWVNFTELKPSVLTTDFAQDIHTGVWVSLNSKGNIAFNYGDGGLANSTSRRTKIGETVLKTGVWYHILGVVQGASAMDIFINGVNDCGTYAGSGSPLVYSNSPGSIGRKDSNPSQPPHYFHGYIDDFYYWDRVVTIDEIFNSLANMTSTNIISFEVPGQLYPATIDSINRTVQLLVNCSSTLDLVPTFEISEKAIVYVNGLKQNSGSTINNFNGELIYTITNSQGCSTFTSDWKVSIEKLEPTNAEVQAITSFTSVEIQGQTKPASINTETNTITFEVICLANLDELYLVFTLEGSTSLMYNGNTQRSGNPFDFLQPLVIELVNQDACSIQEWTIVAEKIKFTMKEILDSDSFFIPNVITPNEDGINEYFILGELLVGSELSIINRYGTSVYLSENYQNEFNGASLSPGVYYYAITNSCYSELIKGTLSILH